MFLPHPNLSDAVNRNIVQSEIEGGVSLEALPPDTVLHIRTQHHFYRAQMLGDNAAMLSGHPQFCPQPVQVVIAGSTWGGSMLKSRYIGRGMHLEFHHPAYRNPIVTSAIEEILELMASPAHSSERRNSRDTGGGMHDDLEDSTLGIQVAHDDSDPDDPIDSAIKHYD